jgi:hypothetical protein
MPACHPNRTRLDHSIARPARSRANQCRMADPGITPWPSADARYTGVAGVAQYYSPGYKNDHHIARYAADITACPCRA